MKKPPQRVGKISFLSLYDGLRCPFLLAPDLLVPAPIGPDRNICAPAASLLDNIDNLPTSWRGRIDRASDSIADCLTDMDCGDGDGSADTDFDDLATDILATVVAMVIAIVVPTTTVAVASATTDIPVAGKGRRGQHERSQCNDNLFHDVLLDK